MKTLFALLAILTIPGIAAAATVTECTSTDSDPDYGYKALVGYTNKNVHVFERTGRGSKLIVALRCAPVNRKADPRTGFKTTLECSDPTIQDDGYLFSVSKKGSQIRAAFVTVTERLVEPITEFTCKRSTMKK